MRTTSTVVDSELEANLIRLFVLYQTSMEPVSSATATFQLELRGLKRDASSVARILRSLEAKGYIASVSIKNGSPAPKSYRATQRGRIELSRAREHIRELFRETYDRRHP